MPDPERSLLIGWTIVVLLGVLYYLSRPNRSWTKKMQEKLAAPRDKYSKDK